MTIEKVIIPKSKKEEHDKKIMEIPIDEDMLVCKSSEIFYKVFFKEIAETASSFLDWTKEQDDSISQMIAYTAIIAAANEIKAKIESAPKITQCCLAAQMLNSEACVHASYMKSMRGELSTILNDIFGGGTKNGTSK